MRPARYVPSIARSGYTQRARAGRRGARGRRAAASPSVPILVLLYMRTPVASGPKLRYIYMSTVYTSARVGVKEYVFEYPGRKFLLSVVHVLLAISFCNHSA